MGCVWLNADAFLNGNGINDGSRSIYVFRNNAGTKQLWENNFLITTSTLGINEWDKVVIGAPSLIPNEASSQCDVFEAICFDRVLSDLEIQNIYNKLVLYYPVS